MNDTYDVIVVGGGGAGLACAVSAAEQGADVLLLEKQPRLGGSTGRAVGSFTASGTALQRRAGITDGPDDHQVDAGLFGPRGYEARNNAALRRYFFGRSSETLDWLSSMGLVFHGPSPEPPNRVPRMHNVVPNAKAYVATLQLRLLRLGGTVACDAPVEELVTESGRVAGVVARIDGRQRVLRARRGVVLAAGDYAGSAAMISKYRGDRFAAIEGINPDATGDGHRLAEQVGARLLNMDITYGPELRFVPPRAGGVEQLLPSSGPLLRLMGLALPLVPGAAMRWMIKRLLVTWQHPEDAILADGAILVNRDGVRFCDETATPDREIAVAAQPGKVAYIVLDERLAARYGAWPHYVSTAPEIAYAYVADYLRLRPDVAVAGTSLAAVAAERGLPADALQRTVDGYGAEATHGGGSATPAGAEAPATGVEGPATRVEAPATRVEAPATGAEAPATRVEAPATRVEAPATRVEAPATRVEGRPALSGSRWVLLGPVKAYFTNTEGGAAIDEDQRVLDLDGQPIPGLYAAGQTGLGGMVLWGHGLHIAWALTSGRLVGQALGRPGPTA